MDRYFFSRRTFNASKNRFRNGVSAKPRYVAMTNRGEEPTRGHMMSAQAWRDQVVQAAGGGDILIYVHGFNTAQNEMLSNMDRFDACLQTANFDGVMVAFDWPSDGRTSSYTADRNDAKRVAASLVHDGVQLLQSHPSQPKVHILGHSMGCFLTLRAFSGARDEPGTAPWKVDQVAFMAADCDCDCMECGVWGDLVMQHRCTRFTNYHAINDKVLDMADGLINGGRDRLGRHGMPNPRRDVFENVCCAGRYDDAIDAGKKSLRYSHNWYFDDVGFAKDLVATLKGTAAGQIGSRRMKPGSQDQELC